jgi:hypothetical protein
VAVVAPAQVGQQIVAKLDALPGKPVRATVVGTEEEARAQLADLTVSGAYLPEQSSGADVLLVASAGGAALSSALRDIFTTLTANEGRPLDVIDVVPRSPGDATGGSVFYLMIGCTLAGYLLAAVISSARGARPATLRRTGWRVGATVPYGVAFGLGAAAVFGPWLEVINGHFASVWLIGSLLVIAAATTTIAFQAIFGFLGVAGSIVVFVVVGNPSAGGVYPYSMLPAAFRAVGPWLPNGAAVDALRRAVYFDAAEIAPRLAVLAVWAVAGAALAVLASVVRARAQRRDSSATVAD